MPRPRDPSWLGIRNERTAAEMRAKYDRSIKSQKKLVLRAVAAGRWSTKEVSQATGISPADCAHLLLELWKAGLVQRFKPIRFGFRMRKAYVYLIPPKSVFKAGPTIDPAPHMTYDSGEQL